MHFTSLILILSLSAGALALPFSNTTTEQIEISDENRNGTLESRGLSNFGWVAWYANTDATCTLGYDVVKGVNTRPEVKGKGCIPFAPTSDNIGIAWGHGPLAFTALDFYSDGNCKNSVHPTFKRPQKYSQKGAGSCVNIKGGSVLAVKGSGGFMG